MADGRCGAGWGAGADGGGHAGGGEEENGGICGLSREGACGQRIASGREEFC